MTAAAADETATAVRAETEESPARRAFRRLLKRCSAVIGLVVVLLFIAVAVLADVVRSEEHTSELQSLMHISYAVFCLKKKKHLNNNHATTITDIFKHTASKQHLQNT